MSARAVCIDVGGGSVQTTVFDEDGTSRFLAGAHEVPGAPLLIAVPGLIEGVRVVAASNLGWFDVDPVAALGLTGPATLVANDAEAAALGEAALAGCADLTYMGLGTGIGGALVRDGVVVAREVFGHGGTFSDRPCSCGLIGCLETVAAGWALPDPLAPASIGPIADALAAAVAAKDTPETVVVAGGMARAYPAIVEALRERLATHTVIASGAPADAKSASPWGLLTLAGLEPISGRSAPAR